MKKDNVLTNAPHTAEHVTADDWTHPYSRESAAFPAPWLKDGKFLASGGAQSTTSSATANLVCTCESVEAYAG